jgi:methylated-DNA-[protein]-cysteine S-methyltransferase
MATIITTTTVPSPIGEIELYASDTGVCAIEFKTATQEELLTQRLRKWFGSDLTMKNSKQPFTAAIEWLEQYFDRDFDNLPEVKLDLRGSDFEMGVWREMLTIKAGDTLTYSAIAKRLGNSNASRAVGNASRRNPVGLIVPCHRVIGANGSLTGYAGGLDRKAWLVSHELSAAGTIFEIQNEPQGLHAQTQF